MRRCSLGASACRSRSAQSARRHRRADYVVALDSNVLRADAAERGIRHWNALAPFARLGQRMNIYGKEHTFMHRNDNATVFLSTLSAPNCSEATVRFKVSRRPLGTR